MKPKKVVITGGPATGKTAIIDNLKLRGYTCFEEVIRKLTTAAQNSGDISESHSNPIALVTDSVLFNTNLINLRLDDFKSSKKLAVEVSFFDRGMPDVLAYMSYFKQDIEPWFINICQQYKYDDVFILPPWKAIYKVDGERFETFEQASAIYKSLKATYAAFGYTVKEVPIGTVDERTDFIIKHLNL